MCNTPRECTLKGCPSAPAIAHIPAGRVNPYLPTPSHIFLCTNCRDSLNLTGAFDGTYVNRGGPAPLPDNPPTDPKDTSTTIPVITITTPTDTMPKPTLHRTGDGMQYMYNFGQVTFMLNSNINRGMHITHNNGEVLEWHEIFAPDTDPSAIRAREDKAQQEEQARQCILEHEKQKDAMKARWAKLT
jgi:hypothetical protein